MSPKLQIWTVGLDETGIIHLPACAVEAMELRSGEKIVFCRGPWPGTLSAVSAVKLREYERALRLAVELASRL